jgi:hypothetical protein
MQLVANWLGSLRRLARKAGPYLLVAMVVPGGSLLALLLVLHQRRLRKEPT